MKIITNINNIDKKEWSNFVNNHPDGNIFQTPEMFDLYNRTEKHDPVVLCIKENEEIVGILLAVIQKEHKGLIGKFSSRSIIMGGPLIKNNDRKILELLLKEYNKTIRRKVIYSQFRNFRDWDVLKDKFENYGFEYEEHLNILFNLDLSKDELLNQMHKQRRHNVRRAKNKGVIFKEITNSNEIKSCYELVKETYKRVKLPYPENSYFQNSYDIFYTNKYIRFFGAYIGKKIIGTRIVLCYKDLVYDWYAGSSFVDKNKYPNDFLPWEVMLWSKNNGYKIFDFGGAGKPGIPYGVRDYKKKFGGEFVNYGRFEKIHNKILFILGSFLFKIYKRIK